MKETGNLPGNLAEQELECTRVRGIDNVIDHEVARGLVAACLEKQESVCAADYGGVLST